MAFRIPPNSGLSRARVLACALVLAGSVCQAEHLPIRVFSGADGLASSSVGCIVRDSRDFLWFCTAEGLSRFDGYTFTNYGTAQGLPSGGAFDFLETRNGEYWVATADAISRFDPEWSKTGGALFEVHAVPHSKTGSQACEMAEAPAGGIWCVTNGALRRFDCPRGHFERIELGRELGWTCLFPDRDGSLWLGTLEGPLVHRWADGRVETLGGVEGLPVRNGRTSAIFRDRAARLWVATWDGLYLLCAHPTKGRRAVERIYSQRDGLAGKVVFDVFQSRSGRLWVGLEKGLSERVPGGPGKPERFRSYSARKGFDMPGIEGPAVDNFAEDANGNLWFSGAGATRLAAGGFTTYTSEDGLKSNSIQAIVEDREGRLIAMSADPQPRFFNVFDGEGFSSFMPRMPARAAGFTWGHGQIHFQDHTGVWWVAGDAGLCRYPRVARVENLAYIPPERVFTTRDGLPSNTVFRLFEDSRGDIWISLIGPDVVTRWSRRDGAIQNFQEGQASRPLGTPTSFAEDRTGSIWMGFFWHDLARYRHGRFEVFTTAEGLPAGVVTCLLTDHAGRLWIATSRGGLGRVDHPELEHPQFRFYTSNSGLSSNTVRSLTEDLAGRIYLSTPRGIDRLNPENGNVRHYPDAEGLRLVEAPVAYRDRHGILWFGGDGLKKFVPGLQDEPPQPPPIRITRLNVSGHDRPVSELGETRIEGLRLRPEDNLVQIDFAGLNFSVGDIIRYQYKLEGADGEWGPPVDNRTVTYASLSAGAYRFLVRTVDGDGLVSPTPATVAFIVLPPLWQRWWFLAGMTALVSLGAVWLHRYRVRQVLELERIRTRIATDLHDDIGSSLTQIAILSEVARRSEEGGITESGAALARIADLSREVVDSLGEIVWAINPQRERLSDLAYRMRRFSSDVLTARDIDFDLVAPANADHIALRAEVRRHIYLIFKECVHNVVRHAGCRHVEIRLQLEAGWLSMKVSDDGKGFPAPPMGGRGPGNGFASMEQRVREMGAHLEIHSEPGCGTTITLSVPLSGGLRPERNYLNR